MKKPSDSIDPHILDSSKLKAFWALDQMGDGTNDRFNPGQIANFLIEKHAIKTSRQAIEYGLKNGRSAVHKNRAGFKLMEDGRKQLYFLTQKDEVIMIEAGKPFSAKNVKLKKILSSLSGQIDVSDPYIDIQTLDSIFKNVDKKEKIRILTQNVIDKPKGVFVRHLDDLRKEGYQIEVGVYCNSDMHDRYLMDSKTFWLSGNSLNYLGNKESFMVRLGEDVRQSMKASFNNRWKIAKKI